MIKTKSPCLPFFLSLKKQNKKEMRKETQPIKNHKLKDTMLRKSFLIFQSKVALSKIDLQLKLIFDNKVW